MAFGAGWPASSEGGLGVEGGKRGKAPCPMRKRQLVRQFGIIMVSAMKFESYKLDKKSCNGLSFACGGPL